MASLLNTAVLRLSVAIANLRARGDERGQTLVEYGLLTGLLAVAIIGGFLLLTQNVTVLSDAIAECINFDNVCP